MKNDNILSVVTPYNKKAILASVSGLTVTKERGNVITRNNGKITSTYRPTKIYEHVNFKDAVNMLLPIVANIFTPLFHNVDIKAGYQELKLRGNEHVINGDVFHEMMWLTNSTDGTKRLSIRYGLMRQICSNGMIRTEHGSSFKVKHLVSNNVNEELKTFMKSLPKFNATEQIKTLKKLEGKTITVKKLADTLVNKIGEKGNETIWKSLVRKLSSSKTDSLGSAQDALITGINVPFVKMTKETLDTKIDSWKILNCYTELWRSLNAGEIERETNKILEILA